MLLIKKKKRDRGPLVAPVVWTPFIYINEIALVVAYFPPPLYLQNVQLHKAET